MATKRTSMKKIREILRLKHDSKLTNRQIGKSLCISPGTVSNYITDAKAVGFTWPIPDGLSDSDLELAIFGKVAGDTEAPKFAAPDWEHVFKELKRKNVTKMLLWQEYRNKYPNNSYSYSQFCTNFNAWCKRRDLSMRQVHKAGEKLFVDYAGHTMPITNPQTGEQTQAQIFIAVLGASNFTYAEASLSQTLPDWIGAHVRAFEYIGGIPEIVVPDNLKSAVKKVCKYDPDLNPTYQKFAEHYGVAVIPARPYKPKDKSKVEVGVQIVERKILARLRDMTFFSLGELNKAIIVLLNELNDQPFQKLPGSRRSLYLQLDKPQLKPLPNDKYRYTEIKIARVHVDYHVEVERHYYSVPYNLVKEKVEAHLCENTITIYHDNKRIITHPRSYKKGRHTTLTEHMPPSHKFHAKWTPERFRTWSSNIGTSTAVIVDLIFEQRQHLEQGYRSCLALLNLSKKYGDIRLERACKRAIDIGAPHRKNIESILQNGLDHLDDQSNNPSKANIIEHDNVRGESYYR